MAFNWQTFRTRTLTAAVFVAIMLTGLLWNFWSFLILFSVIHFGCWWEYLKLTEKIHKISFHIYSKLGLMLMGYAIVLWFCGPTYKLFGYGLKDNFLLPVSGAGFLLLLIGVFQKGIISIKAFGTALLGLIYISLSWGLMINFLYFETIDVHLHDTMYIASSNHLPLLIIISIWISDTMAYIVGSVIGKTPLTKISPQKTWEGTVGGILLSVLLTGVLLPMILFNSNGFIIVIFSILVIVATITGTIGDLFESKLKRMAGVKDSGTLMPGHGGFLDRFDSLLFATPFVWLYIQFLLK